MTTNIYGRERPMNWQTWLKGLGVAMAGGSGVCHCTLGITPITYNTSNQFYDSNFFY